jgi:peptidoglycan biosynthesis protein MviN/MurJ (putative lipid II flippase)
MSLLKDKNANVRLVMGLVTLLITIVVGILVFWQINGSLDPTGSGYISTSRNTTNETAGTIFSLLPIVGIIAVAGIMLAYVSRFGGGGSI